MTQDTITRRLSLIKNLFKLGTEQSKLPETISYTAILSIHDSIDMFMNLAAEKKGNIQHGLSLMQYFDQIPDLTLKSSVNKINKRRNNLKHGGIIPGMIEIEDSCSISKLFFDENVRILFDLEFNDISLNDLVSYTEVRHFLKLGEIELQENNYKKSAVEFAKAYFHLLLAEDSLNKTARENPLYGTDIQPLIREGKFYTKAMDRMLEGQELIFKEPKTDDGYVEIPEGVAALSYRYNQAFTFTFQSLQVLSLGLDYRKYNHFNSFMPKAVSYEVKTNEYKIFVPPGYSDKLTEENMCFARDFILDFALKLQQFSY